jgi:arabinan endo-1,5-alpha-L-arabinosidase
MVGRSKSITGPYVDRGGKKMLEGGGTLLLDGKPRWKGPGHNAILIDNNKYYLVYHSYDAKANGAAMLRVEELLWDAEGWPIAPSQTVGE